MKKDVIYIDVEDDITSIIEKLKNSSEKIVALVPPKGNLVLQSVVNLRLLHRAADKVDKRPVIVSSNQALSALAGGIGLYVAKTLQSKPTIPSGIDFDGDDTAVEVSDDVGSLKVNDPAESTDGDNDEVELSGDELAALTAENKADRSEATKKSDKKKKKKKVPNFNSFRKKALIIGGILLILLIVLLSVFGRTTADIVIRAETSPVDIELSATIDVDATETNESNNTLKAESREVKKTLTQEFTPTGRKNVGERATGSVEFINNTQSSRNIPAGTKLSSSGGLEFVLDSAVQIQGGRVNCNPFPNCQGVPGSAEGDVTAAEPGTKYNAANGNLSGAPSGITASFNDSTSGGTNKTVTVISQSDIDRARNELEEQDEAAVKKELNDGFGEGVKILGDSFSSTIGRVRSEPAVGKEANEARLTAEATYTMLAVSESDLDTLLDAAITAEMPDKDKQRVYGNGLEDATFERVDGNAQRARYQIAALGQYGPKFDIEAMKREITGKKIGEVRSYIQDLPGVKGVDIGLGPFWARSLPGTDRITIKLDVDENASS